MRFIDRRHAGKLLARGLGSAIPDHPVVIGLPRGGVPVAAEVAVALHAPLEVLAVRKIGVPFQPELAMGALTEGGICVRDEAIIKSCRVSDDTFVAAELHELSELHRRVDRYRKGRAIRSLAGHSVVLVDDGIATGSTMLAAVRYVRAHHGGLVIVATPVCSAEAFALLRAEADRVDALVVPHRFGAVGKWYDRFEPTQDEEVQQLFAEAESRLVSAPPKT